MGIEQDAAIVLRAFPYGEADRIVVFATPRFGKIRAIAKGARRPRSRFGAAVQLFHIGQMVFYFKPTRDIQLLSVFETTEPLGGELVDPKLLAYASYFSELAETALVEGESNPRLFAMICAAFRSLRPAAEKGTVETLARAFELKLLAMSGHTPRLDRCVLCGRPTPAATVAVGLRLGGVLCTEHRRRDKTRTLRQETLHWAAQLLKARFVELDRYPPPTASSRVELKRLLRELIQIHWDHPLRTGDYLDNLERALLNTQTHASKTHGSEPLREEGSP